MLKESYSGNYNQGHCTMHDLYLILSSFLIIFGRKLAMEPNIHTHNGIDNVNQVTRTKYLIFYFLLQVSYFQR